MNCENFENDLLYKLHKLVSMCEAGEMCQPNVDMSRGRPSKTEQP